MVWALLAVSEATTASKHPQRSNLTSDLKSVTQIAGNFIYSATYIMGILFWFFPRPLCLEVLILLLSGANFAWLNFQKQNDHNIGCRVDEIACTYLSFCILLRWHGPFWQPQPNSLEGKIQPNLRFPISDPNYLCYHGYFLSKCLLQLNQTGDQIWRIDWCCTPVKMDEKE